jgi:hypothetical protein
MIRFPITFLSTYEGTGYMELNDEMILLRILDEQENEIPNYPPYSYKVTGND